VAVITSARLFDPVLVDQADALLRRAVDERRHLLIDLSIVRFLSSAMLGRLVLLDIDLVGCDRRLVAFQANATVREILRLSGLDQRIPLCADQNEALACARGRH
jgi:anti-anti-sigma regulatory factor